MNNSNNFNICEKCGTANPIVAKYCYQCGGQLRTPEDPIVCSKCNTVNSGSARFCKFCGTKLFAGNSIKVCPRCNHTVYAEASICDRCNFEFPLFTNNILPVLTQPQCTPLNQPAAATVNLSRQQNAALPHPNLAQSAQLPSNINNQEQTQSNAVAASDTADGKKTRRNAKALVGSLLSLILTLCLAYVIIGWEKIVPANWFSWGIFSFLPFYNNGGTVYTTGLNIITDIVNSIFAGALFTMPIYLWVFGVLILLVLLTVLISVIGNIVRLFSAKCAKKATWWYFVLALLSGIVLLGFYLATKNVFLKDILFGASPTVVGYGFMLYIIPGFYMFMFLLSFIFKATKPKNIMDIRR
jgi:ribosomal protein L40E